MMVLDLCCVKKSMYLLLSSGVDIISLEFCLWQDYCCRRSGKIFSRFFR